MSMDQRLTEAAQIRDIGERLRQAARAGDIDALHALIREDTRVLERVDENEDMLMVMWLIDVDGSLVRVKGKGGFTPLHHAAENGNLSILRECFKGYPESIKDVTFQGDTALHIAVKKHQKDAFEFLLMDWLRSSSFEDADFWEGELLNWKNKEGKTVLHIATSEHRWKIDISPSGSSDIEIEVEVFDVEIISG
ncbi:hypothetical protein GH714_038547 [Hevea brasiliensis]|uniref:Uncharacterized protein n=1 Tax=Hevea brasiliensis TaxID=3981 RepID=A0A6A6N569_HEVBR|nr:hypothetical protein GH714_038547 [Hevea brasiliensis]